MNAEQRRQGILSALRENAQPVSASALAGRFGVSRQVIVGDIALLRAKEIPIFATPKGYLLEERGALGRICRIIACRHGGDDKLAQELYAVVDEGGELVDVIVEHPVYGQISGQLHILTRHDADEFLEKLRGERPSPFQPSPGASICIQFPAPAKRFMNESYNLYPKRGFYWKTRIDRSSPSH